jgi:membrane-bound ClpP family serine protease
MALGIIVIIILLGLVLVFLEMFVIPGTALFGILGGIALIAGVALMYTNYGSKFGNITAGITGISLFVAVAAGFKVIQSNRLAMKAEIKSKVNQLEHHHYNIGQVGKTVSSLRPNGKAIFGDDNKVDVYSEGDYIERESSIEIVKITNNKIFVKQSKT